MTLDKDGAGIFAMAATMARERSKDWQVITMDTSRGTDLSSSIDAILTLWSTTPWAQTLSNEAVESSDVGRWRRVAKIVEMSILIKSILLISPFVRNLTGVMPRQYRFVKKCIILGMGFGFRWSRYG